MKTHTRLYLVRHGEVEGNRHFRYVGETDQTLTTKGRAQVAHLEECFRTIPVDAIHSSPLRRTMATAEAIARGAGVATSAAPQLREQSFGRWEGLTRDEVRELGSSDRERLAQMDADPQVGPPDGESLYGVQQRVVDFVKDAVADPSVKNLALISHVGPIKALLAHALGVSLDQIRPFFLDPATISVVDWGERSYLRLFNANGCHAFQGARWLT